jgi:hypothetical protein
MRKIKKFIAERQAELKKHALFECMETSRSPEALGRMARALSWWPMVFQDVLRLNADFVKGTPMARFVDYHRIEDAGHDRWFLDDLRALSIEEPRLNDLFGEEFLPIREACYELIVETFREQTPAQRVAFLLALEPTGHVFFANVTLAVERICPDLPLLYFARSHLGVEKDHDLFTESTDHELDKIVLSEEERAGTEAAVRRIYNLFTGVFTYLLDRMTAVEGKPSHIRALGGADVAQRPVRNASAS